MTSEPAAALVPFRPLLRPDLGHVRAASGALEALLDPLLGRRIDLGPVSREVATRLDGSRTIDDLASEIGRPRDAIEVALRALLLLGALAGSNETTRERVRSACAPGAKHPLRVLAGARFQCQGSGECCQNYAFGPLTAEDVRKLEALDLAGQLPHLPPGPFLETHAYQGRLEKFLRSVDERCVFLESDGRCGIHARFGADAKPALCRRYPLLPILTIDGLKVADVGECASFAVSARSGPPAAELAPGIVAGLGQGELLLHHPIVLLPGGMPSDYGPLAAVQLALEAELERTREPVASALAGVGAVLGDLARELLLCPLAPGEPDATVARVLARVPETFAAQATSVVPDPEAVRVALGTVVSALLGALVPVVRKAKPSPHQGLSARIQRELSEVLFFASALDAPASATRDAYHTEAAAIPLDPDLAATLVLSLRQQLFAERLLVADRLEAGVLRLALATLVAVLGAKLRARAARAPVVGAAELGWAHHVAQRGLRSRFVHDTLVAHETLAWEALAGARALLS